MACITKSAYSKKTMHNKKKGLYNQKQNHCPGELPTVQEDSFNSIDKGPFSALGASS